MSFPRFSLSSFVTLFSFQGTIFYIDFKFKQVCVQFAFSSTSSRTSVRKTEKKCEMCVKLFELVEMRRIELLTPCLQGRCSPSWATPPLNGLPLVRKTVVGLGGLEPPTSRLSGVRSNQLSYRPTECFFFMFWEDDLSKPNNVNYAAMCRPKVTDSVHCTNRMSP